MISQDMMNHRTVAAGHWVEDREPVAGLVQQVALL